jgi:uncharacterized protein YegL
LLELEQFFGFVNMCKGDADQPVANATFDASDVRARCGPLGDGVWVAGLTVGPNHPARCNRQLTRFHFVLDNSGSMGRNSECAKQCFADLVAVATGPCSLITFDISAQLHGENFRSPDEFRAVQLPRQSQTNISAGLEMAFEVIGRSEKSERDVFDERTHHVLVLLSDGAHNRGPHPDQVLPSLGEKMRTELPLLRLSVVVVGVSSNSDTRMGMLMKNTLETVALPTLDAIYFASTPALMNDALVQMRESLASLRGKVMTIHAPPGCLLVRTVGESGRASVDLLADIHEQTLLCLCEVPPVEFQVDGISVQCSSVPADSADVDVELATAALQQLVDDVRVRRVAVGADAVQPALKQLSSWIGALEALAQRHQVASQGLEFCLAKATPAQRLAAHRALKRTTHSAKELFNQLHEIMAHSSNDSASQAAFLVGAASKFGGKALRRAAAHRDDFSMDPHARLQELVADIDCIGPKMREELREDFREKLTFLSADNRAVLLSHFRGIAPTIPPEVLDALCAGSLTVEEISCNSALAELIDSAAAVEQLFALVGGVRTSYLSLFSAFEHLADWCNPKAIIANCATEYQLLMCLGSLGYPIEVQRCAATQMDPYAMKVTRVRTCVADTASLLTALHSDQPIVPPEGGVAIEDILVLVDPDAPRASRLAARSKLLKETYTSVVLCRDLHMFTGNKMRDALHAHAFLAVLQPPPATPEKKDLEAQLRRQYLGRAFQCAECNFGPIDHFACADLEAHHGEDVGGAVINNACPRCGWFSEDLSSWPKWDGTVPKEALHSDVAVSSRNNTPFLTAAAIEMALRICYSARALWNLGPDGDVQALCKKLEAWGEPLTSADGVDHPVQLLMAIAVADDFDIEYLGEQGLLAIMNEVCARRAREDLCKEAGSTEQPVLMAAARKRVSAFLGITKSSAPEAKPLEESEPTREAIMESCCADYSFDSSSFDFESWVRQVLGPWHRALVFVRRLRSVVASRNGGWSQLAKDMERGPDAFADVVSILQKPPGPKDALRKILGIKDQSEWTRVLGTIAAQAFLHHSSASRRCTKDGGNLREELGCVRDSNTLRGLCVELRMAVYEERVSEKMREWSRVGTSLTRQRARAADLNEYSHMCGTHVHGLDGPTFWGLWKAAKGEKAKAFLSTANQGFVAKHGSYKQTEGQNATW